MPEGYIRAAILTLSVALSIAFSYTKSPWCDEGYFGEPGYNLSEAGRLASVVVPPSPVDDPKTTGTDRYIFYAMPLHFVAQAAWYKIFGFGIVSLRGLSVFWSAVALLAWFAILDRLFSNPRVSTIATGSLAINYVFLMAASDGRMDMMSAALGYAGLALYLYFRILHLPLAVSLGFAACAASGLTHPIGGLLSCATLVFVFFFYDRARFHWKLVLWSALPFLLFGLAWGAYISRDPKLFLFQFTHISSGRLSAWKDPLLALTREFGSRYASPFGLGENASPAIRLKAVLLLAFILGAAASFFNRAIRSTPLPWLCAGTVLFMTLFEATKAAAYLVYPVCYFALILGVWIALWSFEHSWKRSAAIAIGILIAGLQVGGSVLAIRRDGYHREYLPAIAYLKQHSGARVFGIVELSFGLGVQTGLIDDSRLGFYNHLQADQIVVDHNYRSNWISYQKENPALFHYIENLMSHYHMVFQDPSYSIYQRN